GEASVWAEFANDSEGLAFESERLLAERLGQPIEQLAEVEEDDLPREGKEREAVLRVRVNQSFFRKRVLSAYCFRCCVTGLETPDLLVASHIIPWAKDKENRLNSRNGLCLNALHDRAFDRHLMWVDSEFRVRFSKRLHSGKDADSESISWLTSFEGRPLLLPKNFRPEPKLLSKHAEIC